MKTVLILLSFLSLSAYAFSEQVLVRSPKALLMGDAFTAVNDDSFTLFYNPASMGRHKKAFSFHPLQVQLSGTNVLKDMDRFKNFPNEPVGVSEVMMNYPAHASVGTAPGFKIYNFGFNLISSESYDVLLRNRSHPMLDVDFKSDRGFIVGAAIPLGDHRIKNFGSQTSLGVGAKYISREGVRDTLALTGPTVIDSLDRGEFNEILKAMGNTKSNTWGFDVGLEHVVRSRNYQFILGLTYLDVGDTTFDATEEVSVSDISGQLNWGMAFGQKFNFFHYIISADLKYLQREMDFGQRFKAGAEIGFAGISLLAGVNGGYYSYGAKLDLGPINLIGGFYDLEIGRHYQQTKSSRMILYLSLFDFSFDI